MSILVGRAINVVLSTDTGLIGIESLVIYYHFHYSWNIFTARLEVGAARRQAIIQQQSQTIKELEVCIIIYNIYISFQLLIYTPYNCIN